MHTHTEPARLAASPEDYARFKLAKRHIEQLDRYQGGELVEYYEKPGSFEECYQASEIHGDQ